jgi:predicted AlkP superfamily phosphohydrolase/phosphomutase
MMAPRTPGPNGPVPESGLESLRRVSLAAPRLSEAAGSPVTCRRRGLSRLVLLLLAGVLLALPVADCARKPPAKLVVIGLDGASWDLLEPWIQAGDLPNLKAFRDGASWGTMMSVVPYLSPTAWTSAVTGVNPGRHGIFDFQRRLPGQPAIVTETAKSRRSPPIWNLLRGSGKTVAIINIPMTDPPDEVDGVMVAGFPHLDKEGFAYPPALEARCKAMGYILDEMEMKLPAGEEESILAGYRAAREKRWELVKQLYAEKEYDLFWVVFTGVDRIQHLYWVFDDPKNPKYDPAKAARFAGTMRKYWMEQDKVLGEFFAAIRPGTTVLILSDHGFGPVRRELRVGNWLRSSASGFSSEQAADIFSLDPSDAARLYVRTPGRDPGGAGGASGPADVRATRDRLSTALLASRDPETGEKPVQTVYPAEQVFVGKYAEKGPDLTALPSNGYYLALGDLTAGFKLPNYGPLTSTLSGWHHMEGIFLLRGPQAALPGKATQVYNLLDVAPTCLYLLGRPLPEDFDGKIMETVLESGLLKKNPPVYKGLLNEEDRPLTPEEQKALKNLPYVG